MALVPSTPWKYCGMVNRMPSMARIGTMARITPQVNEAEANKRRSSKGWPPGRWVSGVPRRRSRPEAPRRRPSWPGRDVAPAVLARLDQAVGQDDQSSRGGRHPDEVQARAFGARDSGTRATTAAEATTTTGTLIRNTQPHQ